MVPTQLLRCTNRKRNIHCKQSFLFVSYTISNSLILNTHKSNNWHKCYVLARARLNKLITGIQLGDGKLSHLLSQMQGNEWYNRCSAVLDRMNDWTLRHYIDWKKRTLEWSLCGSQRTNSPRSLLITSCPGLYAFLKGKKVVSKIDHNRAHQHTLRQVTSQKRQSHYQCVN